MSDSTIPSSTNAELLYLIPPEDGIRAYQHINADPISGERKRNFSREEKGVVIENLRGKEDSVSLDTTGFKYYKHPAKHTSFANDEEIVREYYPESIELIKKLTGASRVELFDHSKLIVIHIRDIILSFCLCSSRPSPPSRSN